MKNLFGRRRRASDDRRVGRSTTDSSSTHPLFSDALDHLPHARWAVACDAEFRAEGRDGVRGILHHDGAILRFTTWGGVERFAAAPMECTWEVSSDGTFRISSSEVNAWFSRIAPLSMYVQNPPPFAAPDDEPLAESLAAWIATWASPQVSPLASPM